MLLAAAIVVTIPVATMAADTNEKPEGTRWYLVTYDAGGSELTAVPWGVIATLSLRKGAASGSTGCNAFGAEYERDGDAMSLHPTSQTYVSCPDATMAVETAYQAALPKVVRWSTTPVGPTGDRSLFLFDADDEHVLQFSSSDTALLARQVTELTDQLEAQQQVIQQLQARIKELGQTD